MVAPVLKNTNKTWTESELQILKNALSDGATLISVAKHLPNRNDGGIRNKAQDFDFGCKNIEGIYIFYENLKKRPSTSSTVKEDVSTEPNQEEKLMSMMLADVVSQHLPMNIKAVV